MFCVECGKEGEIYDGLCAECFLVKRQFIDLPKTLDIVVCSECFAVKMGKIWNDSLSLEKATQLSLENVLKKDRDVVATSLKISIAERDPRNYLAKVEVEYQVRDLRAQKSFQVEVRLHKGTCQKCSRKAGHYYEAIIQIRGSSSPSRKNSLSGARDLVRSRVEELSHQNREIFISKEEKQKGGYDIYLSSGTAARMLARELTKQFGASSKSSASTVGMRDGEELKRMTYLIRLPEYQTGDLLIMSDRIYLLKSTGESSLVLLDLETWQESSISRGRLPVFDLLQREKYTSEATVVSESDKELQLLDPETLRTVDVVKPKGFMRAAETVTIVKTKNGIFLLP